MDSVYSRCESRVIPSRRAMGHFEPAGEASRLLRMNAACGRDASLRSA